MEFEFEKFVKDIEKRDVEIKENRNNEIKAELIQLSIIPTKRPYLQPCNSGLERSSSPIIGNKLKINANKRIGNNSYKSS